MIRLLGMKDNVTVYFLQKMGLLATFHLKVLNTTLNMSIISVAVPGENKQEILCDIIMWAKFCKTNYCWAGFRKRHYK